MAGIHSGVIGGDTSRRGKPRARKQTFIAKSRPAVASGPPQARQASFVVLQPFEHSHGHNDREHANAHQQAPKSPVHHFPCLATFAWSLSGNRRKAPAFRPRGLGRQQINGCKCKSVLAVQRPLRRVGGNPPCARPCALLSNGRHLRRAWRGPAHSFCLRRLTNCQLSGCPQDIASASTSFLDSEYAVG
jgi:hypothetical protein